MPIKPKPFVYVCTLCGWRKVVSPKSDALMPGEYYDKCPACNNHSLRKEEHPNLVEQGIKLVSKFFTS
ncbi:hypothetical protein [Methylomonas koyamae]|uniref:hypothetical protein n=1 Tax=Methylomonas koyamae TaxID=702114 RepID=UPI0009EE6118|nr:hypothetical protein [Methylomonas koyamae]